MTHEEKLRAVCKKILEKKQVCTCRYRPDDYCPEVKRMEGDGE